MNKLIEGIIIKGIGGFYYVEVQDSVNNKEIPEESVQAIYECKARGTFRNKKEKPYVGDKVIIKLHDEGFASIEKIFDRKNKLMRPPIANIDQLVIVASTVEPKPNHFVIDQMIVLAELSSINPIVVISKSDLSSHENLSSIYKSAGFDVIVTSLDSDDGVNQLKEMLESKITAFAGNSGVGKSTLLNKIQPDLNLRAGEISEKLGRGRHTTREVEFFKFKNGYIVDTPGFSSIDLLQNTDIQKNDLAFGFREFRPYLNKCKFNTCSHTCEKGCVIIEHLKNGDIQQSRYDSYVQMYNSIKDIKQWDQKKNYK